MKYTIVLIIAQLMAFIKTDNLVLLSGTLRQFEQTGCDDDQITLRCPPGTSISVELAQYDKTLKKNDKCPPKVPINDVRNTSCTWTTAIQNKWDEMSKGTWGRYSLLQTVVEACQKKRSCKFHASPKSFDGDLCPGERKYVEVAYKCRPYEFRSRVACENERVQLQCNPNSRVAIYSASFGRTEYESFQCPQPQGVSEETCLVSYATETLMKLCHGKRSCEFGADTKTFSNPCRPQTRLYLRIVYTCVPQKVLSPEYEEPLGEDETDQDFTYDQEDFEGIDSTKEKIREFAASPGSAAPNVKQVYKQNDTVNNNMNITRGTSVPFNTHSEKSSSIGGTYLYVVLAVVVVALLCVIIVTSRALVRRHFEEPAAAESKFQATANSQVSAVTVETELDLGTPLPVPHEHHAQHGCHHGNQQQPIIEAVHCHPHFSPDNQMPRVHVHNTCTMTEGYYYG